MALPGAPSQGTAHRGMRRAGRDPGLMAAKAAQAERSLRSCRFCERDCRADRAGGELGDCGCDADSRAFWQGVLWGEETFITPSYAVFFAGCNLRCAFCYAAGSNRRPRTHPRVEVKAVAAAVQRRPQEQVSFSLIGGEPTVHLHTALRLVAALPPDLTTVWNSNFYFSRAAAALLAGAFDVFVADLHFGSDACALKIAQAPHYLEVVGRNLHWARGAGALVVRHLVLPGHLDCCTRPALRWLASELPAVPVHLMTNYQPPESVGIPGLERPLGEGEAASAVETAASLGLRMIE